MNFRSLIMLIIALSFVVAAGRPQTALAEDTATKIVARVNGVPISEQQLQEAVDDLIPRAYFHGSVTPERRAEFRSKALNALIRDELLFQEARRRGMKIEQQEIREGLEKVKARFGGEEKFMKALKASGFTVAMLEKSIERELLIRKLTETEITEKSKVTDEFLKDYYEKHTKDFMRPEAFRLRHILIKVEPTATREERERARSEAEALLARARAGEDFYDLAYYNSMDDWRVKGGDIGLVHRGRLQPELEEAAAKLQVGQVSDVIETIYGYHIIKLEEKVPETQLSFDEVKEGLKKTMQEKRAKELEESLLKRLKEQGKVEIY